MTTIIDGNDKNDPLTGSAKDELLRGGKGDDTLTGGGGNDFFQGGDGSDTVMLSGGISDYTLGYIDSRVVLSHIAGKTRAVLTDVETVSFTNGGSLALSGKIAPAQVADGGNSAIGTLNNGNYVIAWETPGNQTFRGLDTYTDIKYRYYQVDGSYKDYYGPTSLAGLQANPAVTPQKNNSFLLSWDNYPDYVTPPGKTDPFDNLAAILGDAAQRVAGELIPGFGDATTAINILQKWGVFGDNAEPAVQDIAARVITDDQNSSNSSATTVNTQTELPQTLSSSTQLSNGNTVVTWQTTTTGPTIPLPTLELSITTYEPKYEEIHLRLLDAAGKPLGEEINVSKLLFGAYYVPDVIALPGGGFAVAYNTNDAGTNWSEILKVALDIFGLNKFGWSDAVTLDEWIAEYYPLDVDVQIYDNNGNRVKFPAGDGTSAVSFQLNDEPNNTKNQSAPALAALSNGNFAAVWQSETADNGWDIRARLFSPSTGKALGKEITVNSTTAGDQQSPDIVVLDDGNLAIVWASNKGVSGQVVSANGNALTNIGGEFTIDGAAANPAVAALHDGSEGFVVSWGSGVSVKTAQFDASGNPLAAVNKMTAQGTVKDDTLQADWGAQNIQALAGNDKVQAGLDADTIQGDDGDDSLQGEAGNDQLFGGTGNDVLSGGADNDSLLGGDGNDQLKAGQVTVEKGTVVGGNKDSLEGNDGNDTLEGNAGGDTKLSGGAGDDWYIVYSQSTGASNNIIELPGKGNDTAEVIAPGYGWFNLPLEADIETLRISDIGGQVRVNGSNTDNLITAAGNDINEINGLKGNDTLDGGGVIDKKTLPLYYDTTPDTLAGGAGNDWYYLRTGNEVILEKAEQGTDGVYAYADYAMGDNLENLLVNYPSDAKATDPGLTITANGLPNSIGGGAKDDTFKLYQGDVYSILKPDLLTYKGDSIDGGDGVDTVVFADTQKFYSFTSKDGVITMSRVSNNGAIVEPVAYLKNVELLTFIDGDVVVTGGVAANATDGNDSLKGDGGSINGLGGDDQLNFAGTIAATLNGGYGNDTFIVDKNDLIIGLNKVKDDGFDTLQPMYTPGTLNLADYAITVKESGKDVKYPIVEAIRLPVEDKADGITLNGTGVDNLLAGNAGTNTLIGGDGADTLLGMAGSDSLDGGSAEAVKTPGRILRSWQVLDGGPGADTMSGGVGVDIFYQDDAKDVIQGPLDGSGKTQGSVDKLYSSVDLTGDVVPANIRDIYLTGAATTVSFKNSRPTFVYGNESANTLKGQFVYGDNGSDTLDGSLLARGGDGDDTIVGGYEQRGELWGDAGNDTLTSGYAKTTVKMYGGMGDDAYYILNYAGANNSVNRMTTPDEYLGDGKDTVYSQYPFTLPDGIENLVLLSVDAANKSADNNIGAYGNELPNKLVGNDGDNELNGNAGADTLDGGKGDDRYFIDDAGDRVVEKAGAGTDWVNVAKNISALSLADNVENLRLLSDAGAAGVSGNDLNNVLLGNGLSNTLDGGGGGDSLAGGKGDDVYVVDDRNDRISENGDFGKTIQQWDVGGSGGYDTVQSSVSYSITQQDIEALVLTGTQNIDGEGNPANNALTGNSGNNVLNGGGGDDVLDGRGGEDSAVYSTYSKQSLLDYVVAPYGEINPGSYAYLGGIVIAYEGGNRGDGRDVLLNIEQVRFGDTTYSIKALLGIYRIGSALNDDLSGNDIDNVIKGYGGDDTLKGLGGSDTLFGSDGNDTLNGGGGADIMTGGSGSDTYVIDNPKDEIIDPKYIIPKNSDVNSVVSSIDFTLPYAIITHLTLTGEQGLVGTGNQDANSIVGGNGNDTLSGGESDSKFSGNNDTLFGGKGDDVLMDDLGKDYLHGDEGWDKAVFSKDYKSLKFTISVTTGNLFVESPATIGTITLAVVYPDVERLVFNDVVYARTPDPSISKDLLIPLEGEFVPGKDGPDNLLGNRLGDLLYGYGGDDTLDGGAGDDTMNGGDGDDKFKVDSAKDVVVEAAGGGVDTVIAVATATTKIARAHRAPENTPTFTLADNVENLQLSTGIGAANGIGNDLDNRLTGNEQNNRLQGLAGDDILQGNGGADTLDGGAGNDSAWFSGASGDYTVSIDGANLIVDSVGEGQDVLIGIESLKFSDKTVDAKDYTSILAAPKNIALQDTQAADTFAGQKGALSVSDTYRNDTTLVFGIKYGVVDAGTSSQNSVYGTLTLNTADGAYTFTPNAAAIDALAANQSKTVDFTLTVAKNAKVLDTQILSVTLTGADDAPVLTAPNTLKLSGSADLNSDLTGTLSAKDAEGGKLTYGIADGDAVFTSRTGNYGTLTVGKNSGDFTYTPDQTAIDALGAGVTKTEVFTVIASDGASTDTATLNIKITGVDNAPVLETPTALELADSGQDNSFSALTGTLLAKDGDANSTLRYGIKDVSAADGTVEKNSAYGTLQVDESSGAFTFTPNDKAVDALMADVSKTVTFTVTASDGNLTGTATLTVNITGANDTPTLSELSAISLSDSAKTDAFSKQTGTLAGKDADKGDTLSYFVQGGADTSSNDGRYGTLTVDKTSGQYTYVPDASAIDALSNEASETFTLSVVDGGGQTAVQTLTVNITGANDLPVFSSTPSLSYTNTAADDVFAVQTYQAQATDAEDDVVNPFTQQNRPLTYAIQSGTNTVTSLEGSYGTLSVGGGTFSYTPDDAKIEALKSKVGDSFTIQVSDSQGEVATQTLSVVLLVADVGANNAPVLKAPTAVTLYDTSQADKFDDVTGTLTASDADLNASLNYGIKEVTEAGATVSLGNAYGKLTLEKTSGKYSFTPNAQAIDALALSASATVDFIVTVTDGTDSDQQTLSITLKGANDAPILAAPVAIALADSAQADTFAAQTGTLSATDADSKTLTYDIKIGTSVSTTEVIRTGSYGTLTVDKNTGAYSFAAKSSAIDALGADATDTFTVTVTDGYATATQTLTLNLTGVNDAPVVSGTPSLSFTDSAADDSFSTKSFAIVISDPEKNALTYAIQSGAGSVTSLAGSYGTLSVADGTFSYAPDDAKIEALKTNAADLFTILATDSKGASLSQVLTVELTGVDDTAVISGTSSGTVTEDGTTSASGTLTVSDRDDSTTFTAQSNSPGTYGSFSITAGGAWSYSLNNGASSVQNLNWGNAVSDTFTVQTSGGVSQAVTLTIQGSDEAPPPDNTPTFTLTVSGGLATVTGTATDAFAITLNGGTTTRAGSPVTPSSGTLVGDTGVDSSGYAGAVTITLAAGSNTFTGGAPGDTVVIGGLTQTGALALGAGANVVTVATGAVLNGTISATGGTAALTIANGAGVTMSAANYALFNTTGITAAGTETITLSDALTGAATLNANVENFTLAATANSVTVGAAGQSINADALTDAQVLTLAGTQAATVTLVAGDLTSSSSGNTTVTATTGSNVITTGTGDDTITGGAGIDILDGAAGNDTFVYSTSAEFVTTSGTGAVVDSVTGGNGTADKIKISGAIAIQSGDSLARVNTVEQLLAATASGSALTESIVLNSDGALSSIRTIDLSGETNAASTGNIVLTGVTVDTTLKGVNGSGSTNTITGGSGADTITGGAGADTITGAAGIDVLDGAAGNDTFVYATSAEFVTTGGAGTVVDSVTGGSGTADKIKISGAIAIQSGDSLARVNTVEQLLAATASGSALAESIVLNSDGALSSIRTIDLSGETNAASTGNIVLTGVTVDTMLKGVNGSGSTNTITGGSGADTITGAAGIDVLDGAAGDDTFLYSTSAEFVTTGGTGAVVDTVTGGSGTADKIKISGAIAIQSGDSLARVNTVEQLLAATASGSALTESIVLSSDAALSSIRTIDLSGETNAASTGNIDLTGVTVGLTLNGVNGGGSNTIIGSTGVDSITGGDGTDTITGGGGGDVMIGGGGSDSLAGAFAAADIYKYVATTDGSTTPGSGDTIQNTNILSGTDKLQFVNAAFGSLGTGNLLVDSNTVSFNTNENTTLADLQTAANTDANVYSVNLNGSTLNAALYNAIDTRVEAGSAATGTAFYIVGNGTDTVVLYDSAAQTATAGTLIELVKITGLADGIVGFADGDLVIV